MLSSARSLRDCVTVAAVLLLLGSAAVRPAHAVIVFGDQGRNTTAPTGLLALSGWQWQGQWGGFNGTPIGPHHFMTAKHVGLGNGDGTFIFQGVSYTALQSFGDPAGNDLALWQVDGTFPTYAPIFTGNDEVGRNMSFFGAGTIVRGPEIRVDGVLKGWDFADREFARSWGLNTVSRVEDGTESFGEGFGQVLAFNFDQDAGPNEGYIGFGDSGGGMFVETDTGWQLAGINLGFDGFFNYAPVPTGYFAAEIFDMRGLYVGFGDEWEYTSPDLPTPQPAASYSTRISSSADWIRTVVPGAGNAIVAPEPGTLGLVGSAGALLALGTLLRRRKGYGRRK